MGLHNRLEDGEGMQATTNPVSLISTCGANCGSAPKSISDRERYFKTEGKPTPARSDGSRDYLNPGTQHFPPRVCRWCTSLWPMLLSLLLCGFAPTFVTILLMLRINLL
mmetsp:Transcript_467/g.732  ORF Transcript_467/g.732 Transcript_467/m.732 type:complete len:109 (-) Transcript_467:142-468(-)